VPVSLEMSKVTPACQCHRLSVVRLFGTLHVLLASLTMGQAVSSMMPERESSSQSQSWLGGRSDHSLRVRHADRSCRTSGGIGEEQGRSGLVLVFRLTAMFPTRGHTIRASVSCLNVQDSARSTDELLRRIGRWTVYVCRSGEGRPQC